MSLKIRISFWLVILFVYEDLIGSTNSLEERVFQVSTAMPDEDNLPTTKNPLDENQMATGFPNEEESQTNIGSQTEVKGSSSVKSNEDLLGLSLTTKRNFDSVVSTNSIPLIPKVNDSLELKNTSRIEPANKPNAAVNESGTFEDSTDTMLLKSTSDGLVSETENQTTITNGSATSEASNDAKDSDTKYVGLISEEVWNAFNDVAGDLWLPICAIGLVANIFNVIVFTDCRMRNSTNYYLAAISVFQIAYIISSTVTKTHQLIYGDIGQRSTKFFYQGTIYINNYILVIFSRAVFCMVMIVSLERMTAIVFPFRRARSRLVKSPIPCTLCLIIVLFLFHLFSVLKYSVEPKNENGQISYDLKPQGYDLNVLNTFSLVSKIVFVYLPLLGILICNIILCVALRRQSQCRNNLQEGGGDKRREARERQTTVAILVSTFVFFLLVLPVTTNSVVGNLLKNYGYFGTQNRYTFLFMQRMGNFLNLISYSTDFITYVTISSKYRDTLVRKCFPCWMTSKMLDSVQTTLKRSASSHQSIYSSDKG